MIDLIICWYALGWVTCGVDVALATAEERQPLAKLFLLGPVMLAILLIAVLVAAMLKRPDGSKQYLWRKP